MTRAKIPINEEITTKETKIQQFKCSHNPKNRNKSRNLLYIKTPKSLVKQTNFLKILYQKPNLKDPFIHDDNSNIETPPLKNSQHRSNYTPLTQPALLHNFSNHPTQIKSLDKKKFQTFFPETRERIQENGSNGRKGRTQMEFQLRISIISRRRWRG